MCEFCHQHGEGQRWYLQAKNYSEDLLADMQRRRYITEFLAHPEGLAPGVGRLSVLKHSPAIVRNAIVPFLQNRQKKHHWGQVVPIEEIRRILEFTTSAVRMACICRYSAAGKEQRYCYGLSLAPNGGQLLEIIRGIDADYLSGPDNAGLEIISKDELLNSLQQHEKQGLCHTIWTFQTPFIGGICNCGGSDCQALRATINYRFPVMFRAEYRAEVNTESCTGCRRCLRYCQFGAISFSSAAKKVFIDKEQCYGCGICRNGCARDAIRLIERVF